MNPHASKGPIALQRCDTFVGRTMNWLYDHLCCVPRYTPLVLCDQLMNREEFPLIEDWCIDSSFTRRVWRRLTGSRLFPSEWRRLRRLAPSVLHSHFSYVAVGDYALQQALEVPWVVGFYGADVYQRDSLSREQLQEIYAQIFDRTSLALALGPVMKAQLESLGCPAEKAMVHALGVDVEHLPRKSRVLRRGEQLKILFAGTFREKKGLRYAIEGAALARRAGVPLKLGLVGDAGTKDGDRETKEEIFRLIRNLGIEEVVTHHSFIRFNELVELALDSHVFLAPSVIAADGDAEGTPFVLQQMMATGMPVIATLHSDIPYLFGEHKHLLVPERDASAIAHRLQRYADDPDALISDGTALRHQVHQFFDVRKCADRLSTLYDSVC